MTDAVRAVHTSAPQASDPAGEPPRRRATPRASHPAGKPPEPPPRSTSGCGTTGPRSPQRVGRTPWTGGTGCSACAGP